MRKLAKTPPPPILVLKEAEWTAAYVRARTSSERRSAEHWRNPAIKSGLQAESDNRCIYCESQFEATSYLRVDHLIPKSIRRDLAHDWANLAGACEKCNVLKGDFYSADSGILNPYVDDPAQDLVIFGDVVFWQSGSVRGEVTVRQIQLNRIELKQARYERLLTVKALIDRWATAEGDHKLVLAAALRLTAGEGSFVTFVSALLTVSGFAV